MTNEGGENIGFNPKPRKERLEELPSRIKEFREAAKKRLAEKALESNQQTAPIPTVTANEGEDNTKPPKEYEQQILQVNVNHDKNFKYLSKEQRDEINKKKFLSASQVPTENDEKNFKLSPEERREVAASLKEAIEKYRNSPRTPESETEYWQARWNANGALVDMEFVVPPCDRTQEEIQELEEKRRKLIFVPEKFKELTTSEGLTLLGRMYPKMGWNAQKSADILNESNVSGWVDVEAELAAPKRNTTEAEVREKFNTEGRIGMNLVTYIIASQDSKDLNNEYFDEVSWSRLPGSKKKSHASAKGHTLTAGFDRGNFLNYDSSRPDGKDLNLGARSVGLKASSPITPSS